MKKWQKQVEKIVRRKFPDDDLSALVKKATKILETEVEPPEGELGEVIAEAMKQVSEELGPYPLTAIYLGFQIGVAWERYNA